MAKIIYCCIPSYGHLDWGGVLETLQELKTREHDITIATGAMLKERVLSEGFKFLELKLSRIRPQEPRESIEQTLLRHRKDNFFNARESIDATELLIHYTKGKDYTIISDPFFKSASMAANWLRKKYICIGSPKREVPKELKRTIKGEAKEFREKIKPYRADLWDKYPLVCKSPDLNIIYSLPGFLGDTQEDETYVGGSMIKSTDNRKGIYFSSGTLFWNKAQIDAVIDASLELGIPLAMNSNEGVLPFYKRKRVTVHNFCNESEEMPKRELIITQGGAGTFLKAIRSGTPILVLPLFYGNSKQCKSVKRYRVGLCCQGKEGYNKERIKDSIRKILSDKNYITNTKKLQQRFNKLGGSKRAADIIEAVADDRL